MFEVVEVSGDCQVLVDHDPGEVELTLLSPFSYPRAIRETGVTLEPDDIKQSAKAGADELAALRAERDSLRKALDDRFAADQRAAKAIFAETGRTSGFPSGKEVVAYYMAEVERLRSVLAKDDHTIMISFEDGDHQRLSRGVGKLQRENDSLRAKLERANAEAERLEKELAILRRDSGEDL